MLAEFEKSKSWKYSWGYSSAGRALAWHTAE